MTFLQRRLTIYATCHFVGMVVFMVVVIWLMPPFRVWFPLFATLNMAGVAIPISMSWKGTRLLRETQGRICRGCGYGYGDIDARMCPECGRAREKDESTPLL